MRNTRLRAAASVTALLAVGGCRVLASPSEYALYREYRYEPAGPDRLAAGGRYLAAHEGGAFAPEVREVVQAQEEDYWADHRASLDGLNEYLRAFPAGTHVDEARQRLAVYERTRQEGEAARRAAEQVDRRQRREAELREAAASRTAHLDAPRSTAGSASSAASTGGASGVGEIVQGNPEFSAPSRTPRRSAARRTAARTTRSRTSTSRCPAARALPRRATLNLDMVRVGTERNVNQVFTRDAQSRPHPVVGAREPGRCRPGRSAEASETAVRWTMDQLRAIVVASPSPGRRRRRRSCTARPPRPW
jgi:hypothetical protein